MSLFASTTSVELLSPLSKADCIRAFRGAVDSPWSFSGTRPVLGWVGFDTLHARKRIRYRNSFQTYLTATLKLARDGVHVRCSFGMAPFVVAVLSVWFGGVVAIGTAITVSLISTPSNEPNLTLLWFAMPAMLGFGIALVWLGRWLATDERAFLLAFISDTLDATSAND